MAWSSKGTTLTPKPANPGSVVGYASARRWPIAVISACASSKVAVGLSRPTTRHQSLKRPVQIRSRTAGVNVRPTNVAGCQS